MKELKVISLNEQKNLQLIDLLEDLYSEGNLNRYTPEYNFIKEVYNGKFETIDGDVLEEELMEAFDDFLVEHNYNSVVDFVGSVLDLENNEKDFAVFSELGFRTRPYEEYRDYAKEYRDFVIDYILNDAGCVESAYNKAEDEGLYDPENEDCENFELYNEFLKDLDIYDLKDICLSPSAHEGVRIYLLGHLISFDYDSNGLNTKVDYQELLDKYIEL